MEFLADDEDVILSELKKRLLLTGVVVDIKESDGGENVSQTHQRECQTEFPDRKGIIKLLLSSTIDDTS